MVKLPSIPQDKTYLLLRTLMGFTFITHGVARLFYWSVNDFGLFLNSKGIILGIILAWVITIGEIIGGFLLAAGYRVRYVILFNFTIILSGIFFVHLPNGWFVVGHGQNGIEYSLLILAVLLVLYSKAEN